MSQWCNYGVTPVTFQTPDAESFAKQMKAMGVGKE
jgi:hypothetical protein